jgi:hypothetical protein
MQKIRFLAEWMSRDWDEGDFHCFEPDYSSTAFATEDEAKVAAECGMKQSGCNWAEVRRQRYVNGRGWVTGLSWINEGEGWSIVEAQR